MEMTPAVCVMLICLSLHSVIGTNSNKKVISEIVTPQCVLDNILRLERAVNNMTWELSLTKTDLQNTKLELAKTKTELQETKTELQNIETNTKFGKLIFFKAYQKGDKAYRSPDSLVFENIQENIGDAYDNVTGNFTAPVTGLYEFKSRVERISGTSADISIVKENEYLADTTLLSNWEVKGLSSIVKVQKGEHVYVKVIHSHSRYITLRSGFFTQFSGYLIRELYE